MTREIVNSDITAQIASKADVKALLGDLEAYHDPANDKEVKDDINILISPISIIRTKYTHRRDTRRRIGIVKCVVRGGR